MKISTVIQIIKKYFPTVVCIAIGGFIAGKILKIELSDIIYLIIRILTTEIPSWIIISSLVLIYLVKRLFSYIIKRKNLLSYNEDVINNVKWKWSYKHSKNEYLIYNLRPCCPECGTELSTDRLKSCYCPNCGHTFGHIRKEDDIKKIIEQKIEEKFKKKFIKLN